jgi:ribosome biogenesis protein Nip4
MLKFIKKFTDKKIDSVKVENKYFLADNSLIRLNKKLGHKPETLGLLLGEEKSGKFHPSLALLEIISKTSKEKVFVKDIGEIDFIYGKDLRSRHIEKIEGSDKVGFLKLIQNKNDENLGYAKIVKELDAPGFVLKSRLDRGDFLRREK